jgi:hypothetical protein
LLWHFDLAGHPPILNPASLLRGLAPVCGNSRVCGKAKEVESMSDSTEGAGPALAAHSKDASAPGQNPASEMTAEAGTANDGGEALSRLLPRRQTLCAASL